MADTSKLLSRAEEDALLEEACRQWCAVIQEDTDRRDGVGFAHFCRTLSEQLRNDKAFMESFQTGYDLSNIGAISAAAEQARARASQEPNQSCYNAAWHHGYARALEDISRLLDPRQLTKSASKKKRGGSHHER